MADERLLAPIRRFWTEAEVTTAYQAIFNAYHARLEAVTVIIGKGTGDDNASAQVVINSSDYLMWMEALEQRLTELEAVADGVTGENSTTSHAVFNRRTLTC